jgi:hypothetical protein
MYPLELNQWELDLVTGGGDPKPAPAPKQTPPRPPPPPPEPRPQSPPVTFEAGASIAVQSSAGQTAVVGLGFIGIRW